MIFGVTDGPVRRYVKALGERVQVVQNRPGPSYIYPAGGTDTEEGGRAGIYPAGGVADDEAGPTTNRGRPKP